ncbi:MAG: hypothetical protein IJC35_03535 [Oscillospiraceae bacterium]|nr:hypothetical protein [Oscillospiraceae bacterium]
MEKTLKRTVVVLFFLLIFGLSLAHILLPDTEISVSERRYLDTFPEITASKVFSGRYFTELEAYLLDQFPLREEFRTVKALTEFYALDMGETGGIMLSEGHLLPVEAVFHEGQAALAVEKMNDIVETCLDGEAYLAIVPDKGYFLGEETPREIISYVTEGVHARYIDITDLLSLDDFYTTDSHWRQENILPLARELCRELGVPVVPAAGYSRADCGTFYGVYAGQSALPCAPDAMAYLVSGGTENALVHSIETGDMAVYDPAAIGNVDPYDVFLGGPQAVVTIENPNAVSDRHIVIFRDSFASSLAPLMIDSFREITLVDLRYVRSDLLGEYVDFENADILFLYSTSMLNTASLLK